MPESIDIITLIVKAKSPESAIIYAGFHGIVDADILRAERVSANEARLDVYTDRISLERITEWMVEDVQAPFPYGALLYFRKADR